ncbi:FixJ family two-component response regulator [Sphingomonas trueperi]|uniref:response regulator transcription factor n=1 Tax=Sphingomonas trueperi TaxID=53317 RepID=UPI003395E80E
MSERLIVAVIDDDEDIRQALAAMFTSNGYGVECFVSAEQFLGRIEARAISVIVSDLQMAGLSGLELARELHARGVDTPMLLITAFASDAVRLRAKRLGVRVVLEKPFDPAILLREVAAAAG